MSDVDGSAPGRDGWVQEMIEFLRDHPTLTVFVSAVALLLALALIAYAADVWGGVRLERAARRESQESDSPAASAAQEWQGATLDWSPRQWLDDASDPTDPTLGATLRGDAPAPAPAPRGPVAECSARPAEDPESAAARALSDEFDAIVSRLRRRTDQLVDDLTGDHLWLLDEREWCISALRWPTAVTAVAQ
jgi:hypothetical protein